MGCQQGEEIGGGRHGERSIGCKGPLHEPTNHADERQRPKKNICVTDLIGWPTNVVCHQCIGG